MVAFTLTRVKLSATILLKQADYHSLDDSNLLLFNQLNEGLLDFCTKWFDFSSNQILLTVYVKV